MISLEIPARIRPTLDAAAAVADQILRPISRRYDRAEHIRPQELDLVADLLKAATQAGGLRAGAASSGRAESAGSDGRAAGHANLATVLGTMELCRGDVGLLLALPRQGLGNAAIAAVGTAQQRAEYAGRWAAMAITEPEAGSDAGAIRTTATRDGAHYVLNGEKIFVTSGERADVVVVWATLDRALGRRAIKSFVVERSNPGMTLVRLEHKLGIRASDTAAFVLDNCRVPASALLGDPDIAAEDGFAGAMETFDNTRPLVAAMADGLARACLDRTTELLAEAGVMVDPDTPHTAQGAAAARLLDLEADHASAYLLTLKAAWLTDQREPNSMAASMAKAKAGRTAVAIAGACVELCGPIGYAETELVEKWARDAKILDIFEGTQQIQLLVVARRLLDLTSAELA